MNKGISMIETLRDFVEKMNALGVDYMVTGSYAMSAYGEIRMTRDIDVVLQLKEKDIRLLVDQFQDEYYISEESVRRAVELRSMFNVVSLMHGGKVDCIIGKDSEFANASFARGYKQFVAGVEFWTITKEDLIISKLDWARESHSEIQIRDIANLTTEEYDSAYVADWLTRLELREVWAEVEQWKIRHLKQSK